MRLIPDAPDGSVCCLEVCGHAVGAAMIAYSTGATKVFCAGCIAAINRAVRFDNGAFISAGRP